MKLLVLSAPDVHELLGYGQCADAMRAALAALASGRPGPPLRTIVRFAAAPGLMGLMPAYLPAGQSAEQPEARAAYGLKAICITPANPVVATDLLARPGAADLAAAMAVYQAAAGRDAGQWVEF